MYRYRNKLVFSVLLFLLCIAALVFWASSTPSSKQSYQSLVRINLGTEPPTLDPAEADDLVSITVLNNIMRGLVQYDSKGNIQPAYAERWIVSPDHKHYTFYLRKNGRWSDGKPVTAQQFVYAFQRVLNPKTGSPYAFLLFDIVHGRQYNQGLLKPSQKLGVSAPNSYTLQVNLERPIAFFLPIMAFSIALPQREDLITQYGEAYTEAQHSVTNGPYLLSRWQHESEIILKPNPTYWAGTPQNNGIQFLMIPEPNTSLILYENNELDFVETASSLPVKEVRRLQDRPDFYQQPLLGISYLGFNTQKPPLNQPLVRQALAAALDKTTIPKLFKGGETATNSWIPEQLTGSNIQAGIPFNPKQARAWLSKAGYPNGTGFPTVELWYANTTPENRQLAEIAQYQWRKHLGIQVTLKNVEWKVYLKQLDNDPPAIFRLQWYADYPDADSFMNVFLSDSGNNHTRWNSPQYDHWVSQAAVSNNPHQRQQLYNQAQHLLLNQVAALTPLYVIPKSYLLKPNIRGFQLNRLNLITLDNVQKLSDTH